MRDVATPPDAGPAPRAGDEPRWGEPHEPRYRPIESYGLIGDLRTPPWSAATGHRLVLPGARSGAPSCSTTTAPSSTPATC